MAEKADSRQSLLKREEEFLKRFSLRKFTVPSDKLTGHLNALTKPKNNLKSWDRLSQKRFRVEYKELRKAIKSDVPWWLRTLKVGSTSNGEILATLVEEPKGKFYAAKQLTASNEDHHQQVTMISEQNAIISRSPSRMEISLTKKQSVFSQNVQLDIQTIDDFFKSFDNTVDETDKIELQDTDCIERRLSKVLNILNNLEYARLDSGCDKCQGSCMHNEKKQCLDVTKAKCADIPTICSRPAKNVCICDLEDVDMEIEHLCNCLGKLMQSECKEKCHYKDIVQRLCKIRKSLNEFMKKVATSEEAFVPEKLEKIQYFVEPKEPQCKDEKPIGTKNRTPKRRKNKRGCCSFRGNVTSDSCEVVSVKSEKSCEDQHLNEGCQQVFIPCLIVNQGSNIPNKPLDLEGCFQQPSSFEKYSKTTATSQPCQNEGISKNQSVSKQLANFMGVGRCCENENEKPRGCCSGFRSQKTRKSETCSYNEGYADREEDYPLQDVCIEKEKSKGYCSSFRSQKNPQSQTYSYNEGYVDREEECPFQVACVEEEKPRGCCSGLRNQKKTKSQTSCNTGYTGPEVDCLLQVACIENEKSRGCCSGVKKQKPLKSQTCTGYAGPEVDCLLQETYNEKEKPRECCSGCRSQKTPKPNTVNVDPKVDCRKYEQPNGSNLICCHYDKTQKSSKTSTCCCCASDTSKSQTCPLIVVGKCTQECGEYPYYDQSGIEKGENIKRASKTQCTKKQSVEIVAQKKEQSKRDGVMQLKTEEVAVAEVTACGKDSLIKISQRIRIEQIPISDKHKSTVNEKPNEESLTPESKSPKKVSYSGESVCKSASTASILKGKGLKTTIELESEDKSYSHKEEKTPERAIEVQTDASDDDVSCKSVKSDPCNKPDVAIKPCGCPDKPVSKSATGFVGKKRSSRRQEYVEKESRLSKCRERSSSNTRRVESDLCACLQTIRVCSEQNQKPCKQHSRKKSPSTKTAKLIMQQDCCYNCFDVNVPIIKKDLAKELRKMIGNRKRNSVFLKFTLFKSNLYHMQMCTDNAYLGCLYATESAMFEARDCNAFDGLITLMVTDTMNTLSQIECMVDHAFMVVQQEKRRSC